MYCNYAFNDHTALRVPTILTILSALTTYLKMLANTSCKQTSKIFYRPYCTLPTSNSVIT